MSKETAMNQPRNPEPPVDSDQVDSDQVDVDQNSDHDQSDDDGNPERARQPKDESIGVNTNDPKPM